MKKKVREKQKRATAHFDSRAKYLELGCIHLYLKILNLTVILRLAKIQGEQNQRMNS